MHSYASIDHNLIGLRIKEVRKRQGVTQAQLAEMADLSVSYVSHVENAKKKVSLETLLRMCNALEITLDDLLAGTQANAKTDYQSDIGLLLRDCSSEERRFLYEVLKANQDILRRNNWNLEKKFT
ncbi:MAG: helix-turn-helix transcriptional regulator [Lachnospiraceae bacterium]|nr:helix-turn-helix transcriptional regulator [Lachnospiraceae bacterium]